jgi:hypothetical protein
VLNIIEEQIVPNIIEKQAIIIYATLHSQGMS